MGRHYKKKKDENVVLDDHRILTDQPETSAPPSSSKKTELIAEVSTDLTHKAPKKDKMSAKSRGRPRRSTRIQNASSSSKGQGELEPIIELSENERECSQYSPEENQIPQATIDIRCMEEKINHLILLLEQGKASATVIAEAEMYTHNQNPSLADMKSEMRRNKYKKMYIDSHKKMEELQSENNELRLKLEIALGKLEGYEKGQLLFAESFQKFKDACFASTLTKTTQAVLDLSSPPRGTTDDHLSPAASPEARHVAPKRKKSGRKNTRGKGN